MPGYAGKSAVVKLGTVGTPATPVVVAGVAAAGFGHSADSIEVTSFEDANKTYDVSKPDATFGLSGNVTDAVRTQLFALSGTSVAPNAELHPRGTATGTPKYTGTFYVQGYEESVPVGGAIAFTCNFVPSGNVALGTN